MASFRWPATGGGGSAYWKDAASSFAALPSGSVVGEVRLVLDTDEFYEWTGSVWEKVPATGVTGPASATDNAIARFDGTTGKIVQNSSATVADTGEITSNSLTASRVLVSGSSKEVQSSSVTSTTLGYLDATSSIQTQIDGKQATITGAATTITSSNLTASRAVVSDGSGKVAAATTTATEIGYVNGVTSAIQTQLDGKEPTITQLPISKGGTNSTTSLNNNRVMKSSGGAIIEAAAITASRALISDANGIPTHATTTSTEIGYVNGVTSAIQTQIDSKQATITGGATTIASSNLTVSRALVSDGSGKVAVATTTSTEIGYVNGVTSAIQTQIDARLCPTTTVNVSGNVTLTNKAIHFVDTSVARSLTLPAASTSLYIPIKDITGSCQTNNITLLRPGSEKIETVAASFVLNTNLVSVTVVSDGTDYFII